MPETRVFVYGSLKRGFYNHPLLARARFVGAARTGPDFRLYTLGEYPGIIEAPADGYVILGEVYEVDAPLLAALDRLEGHPREYRRRRFDTDAGRAWIYVLATPPPTAELRDGVWTRAHERAAIGADG